MSAPLPAPPLVPVEYPGSDGKPMGETLVHGRCIHDVPGALHGFFAELEALLASGSGATPPEKRRP